jgi:predicted RNase H-like nuclease
MSTPDLRTRIAKVLWKTFQNTPPIEATDEEWESWWIQDGQGQEFYYQQAEAVIRAVSDYRREVSEDDFLDALSEADDE